MMMMMMMMMILKDDDQRYTQRQGYQVAQMVHVLPRRTHWFQVDALLQKKKKRKCSGVEAYMFGSAIWLCCRQCKQNCRFLISLLVGRYDVAGLSLQFRLAGAD